MWLHFFGAKYYIFTGERITEMEEIYHIDFSGLNLKSYSESHLTKGLKVSGIEDYEKFMEKIPDCEINAIAKDGIRKNFSNNTESEWDMEDYEVMYGYTIGPDYYYIYFFEESSGSYSAEIVLSEI